MNESTIHPTEREIQALKESMTYVTLEGKGGRKAATTRRGGCCTC